MHKLGRTTYTSCSPRGLRFHSRPSPIASSFAESMTTITHDVFRKGLSRLASLPSASQRGAAPATSSLSFKRSSIMVEFKRVNEAEELPSVPASLPMKPAPPPYTTLGCESGNISTSAWPVWSSASLRKMMGALWMTDCSSVEKPTTRATVMMPTGGHDGCQPGRS